MSIKNQFLSASVLALLLSGVTGFASEELIWKIGQPDRSDHEFNATMDVRTNGPVVVQIGAGKEAEQWPNFHPASGNGAYGGHPYRFTLAFDLPASAPQGVFYLDLSLLFRQPRTPALELEINGHCGRYHFDPNPMFDIGAVSDEFNPIRSVARRKIALPAALFHAGENRITFVAVDEPSIVITNRNVGGDGDSGFYYDSLALTHDPDVAVAEKFEASLKPTVLFRKTVNGVKEECQLTFGFPSAWQGGKARVTLGDFVTSLEVPKLAEFGEARYSILLPGDVAAGVAKIDLDGKWQNGSSTVAKEETFKLNFAPAKKWKVFYAPNEHLDIGYTDYRAKVAEVHSRNVDNLLKVLKAHPDYRFNFDGSWIIEQWLATRSANEVKQFAADAKAGKIGVNAFYDSFVTDSPGLETFIRHLYYTKELQKKYGVPFDFANITDIPGNSWSVPSVLASAGIRYFTDGGNQDRGPLIALGHWSVRSPFWWEGLDGQRVLTWFSSHYHQFKGVFGLPPTLDDGESGLARFLKTYEQAGYAPDAVLLYGTEVENLPAEFDDAAFVEKWNQEFAYPQIVTCRFPEFFQYVEKHYAADLPVVRGEAGDYWGDNASAVASSTARDRGNQTRAISAESLATITAALNPGLRFPLDLDHDIWRNILLFVEHTYGSHRNGSQPDHDEAVGQLKEKEAQAIRAAGDIDKLMRRSMSQLADQIQNTGENLIVFNPSSWQRSGPVGFMLDDGATLTDVSTGQPVDYEVMADKDGAQTIRFLATDVPSLGYKVYRLGHGQTRQAAAAEQPPANIVENRFYRITLDPSRAAIKSIYDKELGQELVDDASPYRLNEYLFVSGGGTETGHGHGAEASQILQPYHWLPPGELTIHHAENGVLAGVAKTPWGQKIQMTAAADHTPRIETEIVLPDDAKRIEIHNVIQVDLLYAKQASYFAFPWAVTKPTFRYDIANGFVNPATDLLEGGCSDWFAAQHWVNVEGANASVNLAVVDSPLVCLGDIYRGRWAGRFTNSSPTVFSYVLNNYWSSKWAGAKSWELLNRYVITSDRHFDPARSARLGLEAGCPLEISELMASDKLPRSQGTLPAGQASFATLTPDNLVIIAFKAAEDGQGLVVRIFETAGQESDGVLRLPLMKIASASEANAVEVPQKPLEHDVHNVHFHVRPHQILTVTLLTK